MKKQKPWVLVVSAVLIISIVTWIIKNYSTYLLIVGLLGLGITGYLLYSFKKKNNVSQFNKIKPYAIASAVIFIFGIGGQFLSYEKKQPEYDTFAEAEETTETTKEKTETKSSSERKIVISVTSPNYNLDEFTYKIQITAEKDKTVVVKNEKGDILLSQKPNSDERIDFEGSATDNKQTLYITDGDEKREVTILSKNELIEKKKKEEERKLEEAKREEEKREKEEREAAEQLAKEEEEKKQAEEQARIKAEQDANKSRLDNGDITYITDNPSFEQKTTLDQLANIQFNSMFPYKGSKIHSIMGVLQDWKKDGDQWFYKAEATIVNAYGAKRTTNVEITIVPTGPDQGVVNILAY